MTPVKGGGFHRDKSTVAQWIPEPFNLLEGNPFDYSQHTISSISEMEVFEAGIRTRDGDRCVVCGRTEQGILDYCHIIPKVESDTWEEMRHAGFVPRTAKGVAHEARNGIQLCGNHHGLFERHCFYIRWVPQDGRFIFINHSQSEQEEKYHGKAIYLSARDERVPFHGAFLFHEERVRGYWPLREDRAIRYPITWVDWLTDEEDNDDGDNGVGGRRGRRGGRERGGRGRGRGGRGRGRGGRDHGERGGHGHSSNKNASGRVPCRRAPLSGSSPSGKVFIPTNPFANPAELEALKKSFAEQPSWRASVREGTTWEGNADENAAKWRKLNRIDT